MSRKCIFSQETGGATALKSLPTPINLFADECVFCHSFRTSQFHGPMVCYLKGRVVSIDEGNSSDAIYVHRKCLEWASGVWFKDDIVMNFEPEIRRASKLKCRRCGFKGAALGCYYDPCLTSFHVPCAVQTIGCRWDMDGYVLCPEHVSNALPCDKVGTHTNENYNASSLHQSRHAIADTVGNFDHHNRENQQNDQLNTSNASSLPQSHRCHEEGRSTNCSRDNHEQKDKLNSSPYIKKEETFYSHRRKNEQTDHLNISRPYLPHSLHSQQEEISTNSLRDDQQIDQLHTSSSSLPLGCHPDIIEISSGCEGEEMESDQPDTSSCPSDELVLLGFSLSVEEKDFVQKFACWTKATLATEWAENVTHVILGKGAGNSWSRSFEVLMAILHGKWVVHFEWVVDCLQLTPGPEASYEVVGGGAADGPKRGRIRASEGAPKLFSGLCFCLSDFMSPGNRDRMRDLIAAAGGRMLEKRDLHSLLLLRSPDGHHHSSSSVKKPKKPCCPCYFVYDGDAPTRFSSRSLWKEIKEVSEQAAAGAQLIGHVRVLDAVAAYDAEILLSVKKDSFMTS